MSAKRSHKVVNGNSHLRVYPWVHPVTKAERWRVLFKSGDRWKTKTFRTKIAATTAADRMLAEQSEPFAWTALDSDSKAFLAEVHRRVVASDRPAILAMLRANDESSEIGVAVAAYIAHKRTEEGELTPHLRTVELFLDRLTKRFTGQRIASITAPMLSEWLSDISGTLSAKTRRDHRGHLVSFWRWALKQGFAGTDPITAPERLPAPRVETGEKRVLTCAELCAVLNEIGEDFRAWAVLGAFGGLRPEEIAPGPAKKKGKRGLRCEEIDWKFSTIRLPAEVSKTGRARIVPMSDALKAGLEWAGIRAGMTGPVCLLNPSHERELARIGKLLFGGRWPQDALRHSYGSYRNAVLRSLDQVSEEMGNSVTMLHRHYHNPQPEELGAAWFALRPVNERWTEKPALVTERVG